MQLARWRSVHTTGARRSQPPQSRMSESRSVTVVDWRETRASSLLQPCNAASATSPLNTTVCVAAATLQYSRPVHGTPHTHSPSPQQSIQRERNSLNASQPHTWAGLECGCWHCCASQRRRCDAPQVQSVVGDQIMQTANRRCRPHGPANHHPHTNANALVATCRAAHRAC
jgi:hypothetical protein